MNIIYISILLFILYLLLKPKNIETFLDHIDVDDIQYVASKGENSNNMLNNYYIKLVPEHEKRSGFLTDIYDYMGKDNHHYLFDSPHMDKKYDEKPYNFNKDISAYYGKDISKDISKDINKSKDKSRPITYPSQTERTSFLENEIELDKMLIVEPHKYRHPENLENKIVYNFSNSLDFKHEMRERELRLRGFRRSSLTEDNDFLSMTFCDDIDEEGTDFPCSKFGLEFNYDLVNRLKLAKYIDPTDTDMDIDIVNEINDDSANICCKR